MARPDFAITIDRRQGRGRRWRRGRARGIHLENNTRGQVGLSWYILDLVMVYTDLWYIPGISFRRKLIPVYVRYKFATKSYTRDIPGCTKYSKLYRIPES